MMMKWTTFSPRKNQVRLGREKVAGLIRTHYHVNMEREYYIMEVEGEGCYCLCYDDVDGNRVVVDWDLEIRED